VNLCFDCVVPGGTCEETLALEFFSPRRLPAPLLPNHRVRIGDAVARRPGPFIR
jgi:hypothetical protein